jgi:hypothetical protein
MSIVCQGEIIGKVSGMLLNMLRNCFKKILHQTTQKVSHVPNVLNPYTLKCLVYQYFAKIVENSHTAHVSENVGRNKNYNYKRRFFMNLNVEIKPEDINKQITEAVAKSAIGENLKKVIEKEVESMSSKFNNPLDNIVTSEIQRMVIDVIRSEYQQQLREIIKEKISEKFVSEQMDKIWDSWLSNQ